MSDIRRFLAARTLKLHQMVDARAAGFDLQVAAGRDALFAMMRRGFAATERGLDDACAERHLPEWDARKRAYLFAALPDEGNPEQLQRSVVLVSPGEVWGALYVLEGSRIGARHLVRKHPQIATHPFFSIESRPYWPSFLTRLQAADDNGVGRQQMGNGAEKAFAAFL